VRYPIVDGMPNFLDPSQLTEQQLDSLNYYSGVADEYDAMSYLSFDIQHCDEEKTRRKLVNQLQLTPEQKVLEIACGTGRDSVYIAEKLSDKAEFCLFDMNEAMLRKCRSKLTDTKPATEFAIGNACHLPYPDDYFDAVFSFGGLSVFDDIAQSLREMVRVSKKGARVVVGDESLAPWLYDSEYGKILLNNNPLFKAPLPLEHLPVEARDVSVHWVIGGVYYLIDFIVGEGEPPAKFDLPIPGQRGGTLRTRYYGKVEGVTPETYELMEKARAKTNKSKHDWLEEVIRAAAKDA